MKDPAVNTGGTPAGQTSPTLLEKARKNDTAAWERLVALYSPLVYHWCKLAGLKRADAEEVGQEVFLAVARGLANFNHAQEGGTFRGWLRVITKREIIDHAAGPGEVGAGGSTVQRLLAEVPALQPPEDDSSLALEKSILYRRAVELIEVNFERKTCQAFWFLVGGKSAREVAAELQMSVSAVYTAKSKIIKRLNEEFSGLLDAGPSNGPPEVDHECE